MDRKSKLIVSNLANWSWIQISLSVYPSWFCREFRNRSRQLFCRCIVAWAPRLQCTSCRGPWKFSAIIPGKGWGHVPFKQTNFLDYPTHRILSMKKMQKILGNEQKRNQFAIFSRVLIRTDLWGLGWFCHRPLCVATWPMWGESTKSRSWHRPCLRHKPWWMDPEDEVPIGPGLFFWFLFLDFMKFHV